MRSKEDKINALRSHQYSNVLALLIKLALDPNIVWALPPGAPPYKPCELIDIEGVLVREINRKAYIFLQGGNNNLKQSRREELFIQLLETLPPKDAEMLIQIKDKKLPFRGITKSIVNEAFPGLINDE